MHCKILNYNYGGNSINKWQNMNLAFLLNTKTIALVEQGLIKMDYSLGKHWGSPLFCHFLPMD